jgi:hypothetical protein
MGRSRYRPEEDQFSWARCTCMHLWTIHAQETGPCEVCPCELFRPVVDKTEMREAS